MKNKNSLKNLSKLELLELLAEQEKEIEQLKHQLAQKEQLLQQRTLRMERAGNIAQAALELNGIFEAAQRAADQYVESVKAMAAESVKNGDALPDTAYGQTAHSKLAQHPRRTVHRAAAESHVTAEEILQSLNANKILQEAAAPKADGRDPVPHKQEDNK